MKTIQKIGLGFAIVVLVAVNFLPVSNELSVPGRNMLGILISVIVLLVTEVFPIGITCLAAISLMVLYGCCDSVALATSGYTNKVLYFVVASFGISEALTVVPASRRMLVSLMKLFGKNIRKLLFAVMLCIAILSSVISNVAAAAVFVPIVLKMMDIYEDEDDKARTSKCYMIAIPVASMIGGMMTPAGSSINMIAINMLYDNTGMNITFAQWMLFGIPVAAAALVFAWIVCIKVYKPCDVAEETITGYIEEIKVRGRMDTKEKYTITVVLVMLLLWILSSWIQALDITVIALLGLLMFFIPGFNILTWKQFVNCVSWEAFFLVGTMISMGNAVTATGLDKWISSIIFPEKFVESPILIVAFVSVLTFLLLIVIPVAPALVTMLSAPLIAFSTAVGVNPCIIMITLGLCAANCYLLPLDTVALMTYSTGKYKMFDMPKATVIIQAGLIILLSIWIPVASLIVGF